MGKRAAIVGALALASVLVAGYVQADPPDPTPGPPRPVREANVDGNGWIAVHEQGTADVNVTNGELDVNLTNSQIPVTGTVDVGNFPSQQDVNIVGGGLEPVTVMRSRQIIVEDEVTESFGLIHATSVIVTKGDHEVQVSLQGPVVDPDPLFPGWTLLDDGGGQLPVAIYQFANPLPVSGVTVRCLNESPPCAVYVSIAGFPTA